VDLTIVHPNTASGRPLRGSAATFLRYKGEQKNRESAEVCERMIVNLIRMFFDTWGSLHGARKDLAKKVSQDAPPPAGRPAAVGALRMGISV